MLALPINDLSVSKKAIQVSSTRSITGSTNGDNRILDVDCDDRFIGRTGPASFGLISKCPVEQHLLETDRTRGFIGDHQERIPGRPLEALDEKATATGPLWIEI